MSTGHNNRIQNGHAESLSMDDWQQQLAECQDAVVESVRKNPLAATMVVFGVGFSVGTLVGSLLADSSDQRREYLAKSLGRRMLNSISGYVPDRVQQHLPI